MPLARKYGFSLAPIAPETADTCARDPLRQRNRPNKPNEGTRLDQPKSQRPAAYARAFPHDQDPKLTLLAAIARRAPPPSTVIDQTDIPATLKRRPWSCRHTKVAAARARPA